MNKLLIVIFVCCCGCLVDGAIRIGGLFHTKEELEEIAFRYGVQHVNKANVLSCERRYRHSNFSAQPEKVPEHNSYQVSRKVCQLLQTGVAGIFGPSSQDTSIHVQSVCDAMEIPHVEMRFDNNQRRESCSVNLYPHPSSLAKVLVDIVKEWDWKEFTIIYQEPDGLTKMTELLKMYDPKGHTITVRQLQPGDNYRPVLKEIKLSEATNIVLDCTIDILPEVLKQAQQVGLMAAHYSYIITNMDLHTLDLEPFQYSGTNITGINIVDPDDEDVINAVERWNSGEMAHKNLLEVSPKSVRLSVALTHDAVLLFGQALCSLEISKKTEVKRLDCDSKEYWADGYSLINYMKSSEIKGMTGVIKFNQGFRTDFNLNLIELTETGIHKIGTWNVSEGLNLTRVHQRHQLDVEEESLANRTFLILTALTPPYGMLKEDSRQLSGNARFEGFGIDVIDELSQMLGFNYTFKIQEDNKYGNLDKKTKEWNGMIREIRDYRADLAITDLTITHDRESAVDFTMPFMNLGISILFKAPKQQPPSLFSFLSPFSHEVWMYMLGAYVGVSVLLFFMARISPYEWTNPYPCIEEPEFLENQFSLKNSLWFTIGSLMQQGSEIAPIAVSTRMVAGIWWFFTLIMVSSYTANLAAFLTIESTSSPFKNVEELANHKTIKYGAKLGGSTASFFQDSNYSTYKTMWKFMQNNPDVFTSSNDEGLERVINLPNYAFLMESTSIEYLIERNCEVTQIGGLLDNKGYGIAMRQNSSYRNSLSTAVLKLQETGKLTALKRKWWKEKRGGGACGKDSEGSGEASELDLENVGGVFVVLVAGVFIACFITLFEMLWSVRETSKKEKVSFKAELIEELKFVAKCHGSTKPVRKRKSVEDDNNSRSVDADDVEPRNSQQQQQQSAKYGWLIREEKKTPLA